MLQIRMQAKSRGLAEFVGREHGKHQQQLLMAKSPVPDMLQNELLRKQQLRLD